MATSDNNKNSSPIKDSLQTTTLLKRLKALPEKLMRQRILQELMLDLQPEQVLDFLREVLEGADRRKSTHLIAKEAVGDWILAVQDHGPSYELLSEVYRLAKEHGDHGVIHLLVLARPQQGPVNATLTPGDNELSQLSLGERKYLARCHDRNKLERLILDPEPDVVKNILRNPNILEYDVLRLATRRPVREEVLREIFSSRWGNRYRIRKALVCNPYTPTDLAMKLVGFLLRHDLKEVANDGTLHQLIRKEAKRIEAKRRAPIEHDSADGVDNMED